MFDLEPCQLDHSQEKETLQEQIVYSKKILSYSPDIPGGLLDMIAWNSAALLTLPHFSIVRCQENLAKVREALRSGAVQRNFENYLAFIPSHSQESRM